MKRLALAFALAAFSHASLIAQVYLEGTVADSRSGDVLPFVNIAVKGTSVGTISDVNGEFSLSVPDGMCGMELAFSSVGYAQQSLPISGLQGGRASIRLEPIDLNIAEVLVEDKSEAGRKAVKSAIEGMRSWYVSGDYSYSGKYTSMRRIGGKNMQAEYDFSAYDSHGYARGPGNNAFESLSYKFSKVSRNFKVSDFQQGVNYFDFVSGLDFMRTQLGVMNPSTLRDFDFRIESDNADTLVVGFSCLRPSLFSTGAYCPEKYSGTITILKSENVVLGSDYAIELNGLSLLGLSVRQFGDSQRAKVSCRVRYAKFSGKYAMSSIFADIHSPGIDLSEHIDVRAASIKQPAKVHGKVFYTR